MLRNMNNDHQMRKLALIGIVLVVGRGTIAQLAVAIMLSFGFFALQMKTWPYKLEADNLLRAATEVHVRSPTKISLCST